jgi:Sulfotransferase domain
MDSSEAKVFGIGLSKTGTSSLDLALNELGIRSIHFPCDRTTYDELAAGNYQLSLLKQYQALTDIPVAPFYAQLDAAYPNSKFILTVRDVESWLDSVRKHWEFMWRWAENDRSFCEFIMFITACVYGVHRFQRDRFNYVYHRHLHEVRDYFRTRSNQLLILDICAGDGWEKLCPFLSVPIPNRPFPYANRSEEKLERTAWIEALEQAVREFQKTIPSTEPYILIDDEHMAGSLLDEPRRVRRLDERDGQNWGPPPDSAVAIDQVERLRQKGVNYLVIVWPCFWWLDHYTVFDAYLKDRFAVLLHNERLLVMDLRA